MSKAYSMDLRSRVVAAVQSGSSRREAARRFGISASSAVKLLARVRATGSAEPARRGRQPGSGKVGPFEAIVITWVEAKPDITLPELARRLEQEHGVRVHPATLSRLLGRTGWTYKKSRWWQRKSSGPTSPSGAGAGFAGFFPGCVSG